jgi:8-oxo-dGTP pyrophosphatase MutT (NUDIX family)
LQRHFTVSGFVSHGGRTALHWHRLGLWLPPGGHIEPNEDPIEAVRREVLEETGIEVEVLPTAAPFAHIEPPQLPPPVTIGVYDIERDRHTPEAHQHIDFVYFTRPVPGASLDLPASDEGWLWVEEGALLDEAPCLDLPTRHGPSKSARVPDDVRRLALASIEASRTRERR